MSVGRSSTARPTIFSGSKHAIINPSSHPVYGQQEDGGKKEVEEDEVLTTFWSILNIFPNFEKNECYSVILHTFNDKDGM
jgi:hypothetical protein